MNIIIPQKLEKLIDDAGLITNNWYQFLSKVVLFIAYHGLTGTTAQRPKRMYAGQLYLDTTLVATIGKPIWASADLNSWIDSSGAVV